VALGYCVLCQRNVPLSRNFGSGSLIAVLVTCGAWLFAMPFYSRRCTICKGATISRPPAALSRELSLAALMITLALLIFARSSNDRPDTSKQHFRTSSDPALARTGVGPVTAEPAMPVKSGAAPLRSVTEQSIAGTTPMPKLYQSDPLLCGQYQICTAREFKAVVRHLEITWNLMPESYRLQCVSKNTVPDMSNCIVTGQMDFFSKHADEHQNLLERQNPWLYERDRNGNPIQPPPGSIH
jgi:hypothetical protein